MGKTTATEESIAESTHSDSAAETKDGDKKKRRRVQQSDDIDDGIDVSARAVDPPELPPGYICNACKQPGHAIYMCPLKISKKRKEKKSVFMSRLPKTWDRAAFTCFLTSAEVDENAVVNTNMVMNSTAEGGFSGVVILTIEGTETLAKILQLNGKLVGGREIIVKLNTPQQSKHVQKKCARCGGAHDIATCNNPRVCYRCRKTDHISSECPKRSSKFEVE